MTTRHSKSIANKVLANIAYGKPQMSGTKRRAFAITSDLANYMLTFHNELWGNLSKVIMPSIYISVDEHTFLKLTQFPQKIFDRYVSDSSFSELVYHFYVHNGRVTERHKKFEGLVRAWLMINKERLALGAMYGNL